MAQLDEPSVEAEKIPSAGAIGGDNQVGNSSVAIASSAATAVDPLTDALAALDRRDYATAQRLFEACGRKDAAAAIEDAWAALDRKDYATAQRLFEALGRKDAAAAQAKGSARADLLPPPEPTAASGTGVRWWCPELPGSTETRTIAGRSYSVWGCSVSPNSPLRGSRKGKSARFKAAVSRNRIGVFCDLRCICFLWPAAKLDVRHHEKPGDRRSSLSC